MVNYLATSVEENFSTDNKLDWHFRRFPLNNIYVNMVLLSFLTHLTFNAELHGRALRGITLR